MRIPLENKSFLIVDDFGDMRSMLRSMLSLFGVTKIENASNGKEAIQRLENNRYDIVLCDYNLGPGKDGQQVLEEARHRKLISYSTIFVIITAESKQQMVLGAMEYQPDSYLSKPFSKDLLRSRIEKLLVKKQDLEAVDTALAQNEYGRAIALLNKRIANKPKNLAELTRLKADVCYRTGAYDESSVVYEQVLALRELPWARLGLGKIHYVRGEHRTARETFEGLIKDNQCLTEAYDWLSKTLRAEGDNEQAQEILEAAVALSPKAILRQQALGEVAMENGDYQRAEQAYEHALMIGKHSVHKHPCLYAKLIEARISNAKSGGSNINNSMELLRQMERDFGRDKEARVYSALSEVLIQEHQQQDEKAGQCLERAEQIYAQLGTQVDTNLTLEMGRSYARSGATGKAEALFRLLIRNNHDNEELLQKLEAVYKQTGLSDNPTQVIDQIRHEVVTLNNQGVRMATGGQIQEAISLFEEAADGMTNNKTINLNAARVLIMRMEKQGPDRESLNKARIYLERSSKIAPGDPTLARVTNKFQCLANNT